MTEYQKRARRESRVSQIAISVCLLSCSIVLHL